MDVIALHSVGITNAVATLGTAITSEQARVMSRYTKRVIISYDSDEAGVKAATRAMKLLEEVGLEVNVLSVPGAKDPDEYIKKFGVDKFKQVISGAKSKFDYSLDAILSKYDISLPQDKINALAEVEKLISEVNSMAERDVYINTISKRFEVQANSIRADIEKIISKRERAFKRNQTQKVRQESVGYSDRINPDFLKSPAVARNEETVLGLLLLFPNHRKKVFTEHLLSADDFITDLNKRIFTHLEKAYQDGDEHLISMNYEFTPDELGRISRMKIRRMELSANDDIVLIECIENLKKSVDKKVSEKTDTIDKLNEILSKKRVD
jgi:DNA primase